MSITWEFQSCADLTASHVQRALAITAGEPPPREKALSLLRHMAAVARPSQGATKMLVVLAKMAEASWIAGMLEVRVKRAGEGAVAIDVFLDDGIDTTRLLNGLVVGVPYDEFDATISLHVSRLVPLQVKPGLEPGTLRLLARGGSSARLAIPGGPVDVQKTIRRQVAIPREAFRDPGAVKKLEADLEGLDEGWE